MSHLIDVIDGTDRQKVYVGRCVLRRQDGASWEYHPADGSHESVYVIWDGGILPDDGDVTVALGCDSCLGPALFYIGATEQPPDEIVASDWAFKGAVCRLGVEMTCQMCGVALTQQPTRTEGGLALAN